MTIFHNLFSLSITLWTCFLGAADTPTLENAQTWPTTSWTPSLHLAYLEKRLLILALTDLNFLWSGRGPKDFFKVHVLLKASQCHSIHVWTRISQWPSEAQLNTTDDGMHRNKKIILKQEGHVWERQFVHELKPPESSICREMASSHCAEEQYLPGGTL